MGAIYNQASLTLVAAAGDDANYGLSGVSRVRSAAQKAFKVRKHEILGHDEDLEPAFLNCTWFQRGWT